MLRKIFSFCKNISENFYTMPPLALSRALRNQLASKVYYTPKVQKFAFTGELAQYLRYLNRKDKIKTQDLKSLVQAIITEYGAVHGLENSPKFENNINYSITKNYRFKPNQISHYHGEVDYMIWLNSTHFVPVMFFEDYLNPVAGMALAHATMALKCMARNDMRNSGYSIITTGQEWQMFKVFSNERCEKTVVYEGRNAFKNIIEDYQMIQTVLGIIDECLQTEREDIKVLKLAYEVIDERRYMLEANSKEQAVKSSPISKLLVKYFQKKEEQNSK